MLHFLSGNPESCNLASHVQPEPPITGTIIFHLLISFCYLGYEVCREQKRGETEDGVCHPVRAQAKGPRSCSEVDTLIDFSCKSWA